MLAADHRQTLGLRNAQPHLVETGFQHILADQGLPCSIGEHGGLLFVAFLGAALRLDLLVLVVVLRIVDFLPLMTPTRGSLPEKPISVFRERMKAKRRLR